MNKPIEVIKYRGHEIEIFYDEFCESPDDWGNDEVFLVYDHRDFRVKRKGFDPETIFDSLLKKKSKFEGHWVFPVYAYIHSGIISLSLYKGSYPFTCPWDTSFRGFVLVKCDTEIEKSYNEELETARKRAEGLIKTWNEYLSGEVYGYNSEVGGCWNFYGEEGKKQMIAKAKLEIDQYINEQNSLTKFNHITKLKTWIRNRVPLYVRTPLVLPY